MANIFPNTISLKCPSFEYIAYNDSSQLDLVLLQPTEYILLFNEPPINGPVDDVSRTEFVTYTN